MAVPRALLGRRPAHAFSRPGGILAVPRSVAEVIGIAQHRPRPIFCRFLFSSHLSGIKSVFVLFL